jgi:hypothetical protein
MIRVVLSPPYTRVASFDEMLLVLVQVRIEQVHRTTADVHPPGLEEHVLIPIADRALQRLAFHVEHGLDRQVLGIQPRVVLRLPVVASMACWK